MNRLSDACECPDFTDKSPDGKLHACGTILCKFWTGFKETVNNKKEEKNDAQ